MSTNISEAALSGDATAAGLSGDGPVAGLSGGAAVALEELLSARLRQAQEGIRRADEKATALLGWIGAALAVIATALAAGGTRQVTSRYAAAALAGGWVGAALLAGAVTLLVLVIRPYFTGSTWGRYAQATTADGVLALVRAEAAEPQRAREERLARAVGAMARLAWRKQRRVQLATSLLLASLAVFTASAFCYGLAT